MLDDWNCFAVRSAARQVSQFYDQFLALNALRSFARRSAPSSLADNAITHLDRSLVLAAGHASIKARPKAVS
jgi:hypothetical protein